MIYILTEPTEEEQKVLEKVEELLTSIKLELIGTRPIRDRG